MIVTVQRVQQASVSVAGSIVGQIARGVLLLIAVDRTDVVDSQAGAGPVLEREPITALAQKIAKLRIFPSQDSHFGQSLGDVGGSALCISQFTLPGRTKKGTKPSFERAASAELGRQGYEFFCEQLAQLVPVQTGVFAADMTICSEFDGPVTLLCGTKGTETPWA